MKQIKFSENEIKELGIFYRLELGKAEQRVDELKNIITKLKSGAGKTTGKTKGKRGRPPRVASVIAPKIKKQKRATAQPRRAKSHNWVEFVPATLKQQNKYLSINEVASIALKKFSIPEKGRDGIVKTLGITLPRMAKLNRLIVKKKSGSKAKFYGLPSFMKDKKKQALALVPAEASNN